jgi:hypothetical protein
MDDEFQEYTVDDLVKDRIITSDPPGPYKFRNETPNAITCMAGGAEMLKVSDKGFWVRGVKVEQDEQEAKKVYEAFKAWMMWAQLNREYI